MAKSIIGVDIGASDTKIVTCEPGNVRRAAVVRTPDSMLSNGRVSSFAAMADYLRQSVANSKIPGKSCAYVLPKEVAVSRLVTVPAMSYEQLKINLPYEFRDYISGEKDKYFYDFAVQELLKNEEGVITEYVLQAAAAPKSVIADAGSMFRRARLRLRSAIPEEFAYANLIRLYEKQNPTKVMREYCIIDLGHMATRIHMFKGDRFETTRVVETGGSALDDAIATEMGVDIHIAHEYKEANNNGEQELAICTGIYNSIALDIMRSVNFYSYNSPNSNLTEAFLCGGGSNIPSLCKAVSDATGLKIRMISELMPAGVAYNVAAQLIPAAFGITQQ